MPVQRHLPSPRPWFQSARFLLFLVLLLAVYIYGWRVTKIDLPELVGGARFVKPFIFDLVRPDVLERDTRREGVRIGNKQQVATFRTDAQGAFSTTVIVPEVFQGPDAVAQGAQQRLIARVNWPVGPRRLSNTLRLVLEKVLETIFLALMGTTIAVIVAIPLSFLGARNLMTRTPVGTVVYYAVRTVFNAVRSIEVLILAIIFVVWVGLGPFAGVLALAVHSVAALGKLYSEQIESMEPGPMEAVTATGASALQVVRYAVVPQVVPPFIAFTILRWDTNVRMSTVIGFVGGGGIGFILQQYINLLQYRQGAGPAGGVPTGGAGVGFFSARGGRGSADGLGQPGGYPAGARRRSSPPRRGGPGARRSRGGRRRARRRALRPRPRRPRPRPA